MICPNTFHSDSLRPNANCKQVLCSELAQMNLGISFGEYSKKKISCFSSNNFVCHQHCCSRQMCLSFLVSRNVNPLSVVNEFNVVTFESNVFSSKAFDQLDLFFHLSNTSGNFFLSLINYKTNQNFFLLNTLNHNIHISSSTPNFIHIFIEKKLTSCKLFMIFGFTKYEIIYKSLIDIDLNGLFKFRSSTKQDEIIRTAWFDNFGMGMHCIPQFICHYFDSFSIVLPLQTFSSDSFPLNCRSRFHFYLITI